MASPLGSAPAILAGVAIGGAASTAVTPALETSRQTAWQAVPFRLLEVNLLARLIAEGGVPLDGQAYDSAAREGYNSDKLDALIYMAQTVPGLAEAFDLWRRDRISDADFEHTLIKAGMDSRYIGPIMELKTAVLLTPEELAVMVQRGIVPNDGLLPVGPPTATGQVPPMPMIGVDPVAEAARSGLDQERLAGIARIIGLPAPPDLAARMVFRGIIDRVDFDRAISEGNTRNEWAPFLFDGFRQILTANQYAELELRGYYDRATRLTNTHKSGMSDADSDLLYNVLGRSVPVHGVTTGLARGGQYPGSYANVPQPYKAAIQRSNIREEYSELAYANRYSYPSGFQVRAEAQKGDLSEAQTEQLLLEMGWKPQWATHFAQAWTGTTAATGDPHTSKAETQLWGTTHRSYVAEEIDDPTATAALNAAGVAQGAIPAVLALWAQERALVRKQLTPANIRKALNSGAINPATGAAWTTPEAHAALLARGYDDADATVFLEL